MFARTSPRPPGVRDAPSAAEEAARLLLGRIEEALKYDALLFVFRSESVDLVYVEGQAGGAEQMLDGLYDDVEGTVLVQVSTGEDGAASLGYRAAWSGEPEYRLKIRARARARMMIEEHQPA